MSANQQRELVEALSPYAGQKFTIDCAVNDAEAHHLAGEMLDALVKAGWQMISYVPMWDPGFSSANNWNNFFGVQWFEREGAPHMPAAPALRQALKKCCRITADGVNWPDPEATMESDIIYVWVGPDNKLLQQP